MKTNNPWKLAYEKVMKELWKHSKKYQKDMEGFFRADGFLLSFDIMHANKPTEPKRRKKR